MESNKVQVCNFCLKSSIYVCPRCGINYCSINCYRNKKHEICTEAFYKGCCMESMRGMFSSKSQKLKMVEILKRESMASTELDTENFKFKNKSDQMDDQFNEEDEDYDDGDCIDDDDDFQKRFGTVNLKHDNIDFDILWSRLTLKEKRDFGRMIETNTIGQYILPWTPWWLESTKPLIKEVHGDDNENVDVVPLAKPLSKLLSGTVLPHSSIGFSLLEIIISYAFVQRLYNGDCTELIEESGLLFCNLVKCFSPVMSNKEQQFLVSKSHIDISDKTRILIPQNSKPSILFTCVSDVLGSVQLCLMNSNQPCSPALMVLLLEDASRILEYIPFCSRVLYDAHKMVILFKKAIEKDDVSKSQSDLLSLISRSHHKLIFLRACFHLVDKKSRQWQKACLPNLWKLVSDELLHRLNDVHLKTFDDGKVKGPSAGPNWWQMVRNTNLLANKNEYLLQTKRLIEPN